MPAPPFLGLTSQSMWPNATWLHSAPPSNGPSVQLLPALQTLPTWPNPFGFSQGSRIMLGDGSAGYTTISGNHGGSLTGPYSVPNPIVTSDNPTGVWMAAPNGDAHATIINPTTNQYWDMWLLNVTNGTIGSNPVCGRIETGNIYVGDGVPGTEAISLASFAGTILPGELSNPYYIQHAMTCAAPFNICVPGLGPWGPTDAFGNDGTAASGPFQEGQMIFIPPSVNIAALPGLTVADQAIAYALQRYGCLIADVDGYYLVLNTNLYGANVPPFSSGMQSLCQYLYITTSGSSRPTTTSPPPVPPPPAVTPPAGVSIPYTVASAVAPQKIGTFPNVDAAQITTDGSSGNFFKTTLMGNRNLARPTNMLDGGVYYWQFTQDQLGTRSLTFDPIFQFGANATRTLSTAPGATDTLRGIYSSVGGYATLNPGFTASVAPTLGYTQLGSTSITWTGPPGTNENIGGFSAAPLGRYYIEATITNAGGGSNGGVGFAGSTWSPIGGYIGSGANGVAFSDDGKLYFNGISTAYSSSNPTAGQTLALALDTTVSPPLAWAKNISAGTGWNNDILANQNPAVGSQVGGRALTGFTGASGLNVGASVTAAGQTWTIHPHEDTFVGTIPVGFTPLPAPTIRADIITGSASTSLGSYVDPTLTFSQNIQNMSLTTFYDHLFGTTATPAQGQVRIASAADLTQNGWQSVAGAQLSGQIDVSQPFTSTANFNFQTDRLNFTATLDASQVATLPNILAFAGNVTLDGVTQIPIENFGLTNTSQISLGQIGSILSGTTFVVTGIPVAGASGTGKVLALHLPGGTAYNPGSFIYASGNVSVWTPYYAYTVASQTNPDGSHTTFTTNINVSSGVIAGMCAHYLTSGGLYYYLNTAATSDPPKVTSTGTNTITVSPQNVSVGGISIAPIPNTSNDWLVLTPFIRSCAMSHSGAGAMPTPRFAGVKTVAYECVFQLPQTTYRKPNPLNLANIQAILTANPHPPMGLFPAHWLFGGSGQITDTSELDFFEFFFNVSGDATGVLMNPLGPGNQSGNTSTSLPVYNIVRNPVSSTYPLGGVSASGGNSVTFNTRDFGDGTWHKSAVIWTSDQVYWFLDDYLVQYCNYTWTSLAPGNQLVDMYCGGISQVNQTQFLFPFHTSQFPYSMGIQRLRCLIR